MVGAEQRWLVKAIRETGGEIRSQFGALGGDIARWRPNDDEWCLTEVLGHLRDTEDLHLKWLNRMVGQHLPRLPHVDLDEWPAERRYAQQPAHRFIREFATARRETVDLLWSLMPDDWELAGEHPYRGRISILDLARDINQHDLEHLWQARRLLRAYETAQGLAAGSLLE